MSRLSHLVIVTASCVAACSSSHHVDETAADSSTPTDDGGVSAGDSGAFPTLVTEPDQGMTIFYDFLSSAKKTIDMTMYEQTDPTVTSALTQAAKSGVTVRVILDQNLEMMDNTTAYDALSAAKIDVHWANPTYAATHQKTITIDDTRSAIMTLNFAPDDYKTSRDFAFFDTNAADVAAIETVFAADLTNSAVNPPVAGNLVWSPTNSESALLGIIGGAKASLMVENEEMSDSDVVSALSSAASKGIDVKVIMEDSKSYTSEFTQLKTAGVKLVTYEHAALYIHAKVIMADYGTGTAKLFLGSENFSYASLTENRELGIVTSDESVMSSMNTTLTSDFNGGVAYTPAATPSDGG